MNVPLILAKITPLALMKSTNSLVFVKRDLLTVYVVPTSTTVKVTHACMEANVTTVSMNIAATALTPDLKVPIVKSTLMSVLWAGAPIMLPAMMGSMITLVTVFLDTKAKIARRT